MSSNRSGARRRLLTLIAVGVAALAASVSTVYAKSASDVVSHSTAAPAGARAELAAASGAGAFLGGFTSQGWPVALGLSSANRIAVVATGLVMRCSSGDRFAIEDAWARLPIRAHGRVAAKQSIPPQAGTPLVGGSHAVSGRFNRSRTEFTGTWRLHLTFQANGQTDQCDSGRVSLFAK